MSEKATLSRRDRPQTTVEHALDGLRLAIVAGELRPGERIRQEVVADQMGISIAPLREALAVLEQEGQVAYEPRRGYRVTKLRFEDLAEIYELRENLETRAAREALPNLDAETCERIRLAARDCADAASAGDVAAELEANRRFHFAILQHPGNPHAMRLIRLLWDSTECYRAMYYNSPKQRNQSIKAHDRIIAAIEEQDARSLIRELDRHRTQALEALERILKRG